MNLPDVLCLQETYLTKNITPILRGYKFIRKDRSNGKRGCGICICIKPSIPFSEVIIPNSQNDAESMAIKVSGIVILYVYNPPSNIVDNNILQFITNFRNVIICGDFNAHHKMWDARPANSNGYRLLDFIEQNDYSVMNTDQPTHINLNSGLNCSLIDLTLCSPAIAHKCVIDVTGDFLNSDHCLILAKINSSANPLPSQWSPRWSLNRADWISFYQLCDVEIPMNLFSTETHLFYYRLSSTIFSIAERTIPTTKPYGKLSVPWWNKNCQIAINNKKHALNRMLKTRHPTDIVTFKRASAKAKKIVNEAKRSC